MRVEVREVNGHPIPSLPDEPQPRRSLLFAMLRDANGQEDLYLGEIAKAEAGQTILDLYNNFVDVQLYPDGRAIIEELRYTPEEEEEMGPPQRIELTVQEVKQLILDWLEAERRWVEDKRRREAN